MRQCNKNPEIKIEKNPRSITERGDFARKILSNNIYRFNSK